MGWADIGLYLNVVPTKDRSLHRHMRAETRDPYLIHRRPCCGEEGEFLLRHAAKQGVGPEGNRLKPAVIRSSIHQYNS